MAILANAGQQWTASANTNNKWQSWQPAAIIANNGNPFCQMLAIVANIAIAMIAIMANTGKNGNSSNTGKHLH